jgi:hypothetical protein
MDAQRRPAHDAHPRMPEHRMSTHAVTAAAVAAALALAACGKVEERAAEKMIESSMSKDGTQAKVNMTEGGMKITTTDASGKATQMEMGSAQVSEGEVGVPFYPGTKPKEGGSMRMVSGAQQHLQVALHSDDAPDKVAAFYRDKLKALGEGKQMMDMSSGDGAVLSVVDDKNKSAIQVHVGKADPKGSDIMIIATRGGS